MYELRLAWTEGFISSKIAEFWHEKFKAPTPNKGQASGSWWLTVSYGHVQKHGRLTDQSNRLSHGAVMRCLNAVTGAVPRMVSRQSCVVLAEILVQPFADVWAVPGLD